MMTSKTGEVRELLPDVSVHSSSAGDSDESVDIWVWAKKSAYESYRVTGRNVSSSRRGKRVRLGTVLHMEKVKCMSVCRSA